MPLSGKKGGGISDNDSHVHLLLIFPLNRFTLSLNGIYMIRIKFQCLTTKHRGIEPMHTKFLVQYKKKKIVHMIWTDYCTFRRRLATSILAISQAYWVVSCIFKNKIRWNMHAFYLFKNKEANIQMHLSSWWKALYNQQKESHRSHCVFHRGVITQAC